jgi:hypothetical protein
MCGHWLTWNADVACESLSTYALTWSKLIEANLLQKWLKLGTKKTIMIVGGQSCKFVKGDEKCNLA